MGIAIRFAIARAHERALQRKKKRIKTYGDARARELLHGEHRERWNELEWGMDDVRDGDDRGRTTDVRVTVHMTHSVGRSRGDRSSGRRARDVDADDDDDDDGGGKKRERIQEVRILRRRVVRRAR